MAVNPDSPSWASRRFGKTDTWWKEGLGEFTKEVMLTSQLRKHLSCITICDSQNKAVVNIGMPHFTDEEIETKQV